MLWVSTIIFAFSASNGWGEPFDGTDVGYDALLKTAPEEFEWKCLTANTTIPRWAEGDFVIPTVGRFELGNRHFVGFGDAFAKLHRFRMKGSQVCATYRMMATGFYNNSLRDGTIGRGILFKETEPPRDCPGGPLGEQWCRLQNIEAPNDNNFVNTVGVGKTMYALSDTPFGIEVDRETLGVVGKVVWEDTLTTAKVPFSGSAHPLPHPTTGDMIDFVGTKNVFTGHATINVFSLKAENPKKRNNIIDTDVGTPPYIHAFGLTNQHIVLPHMPINFDFLGAATSGDMTKAFVEVSLTKPGPDNAFHIRPLNGSTPFVRTLPVEDRLYYTHVVNTYENATGIVIDLSTGPMNPFSRNLTVAAMLDKATRDSDTTGLMVVRRFLLPFDGSMQVTSEDLTDRRHATDFTKVNPRVNGIKHCFYWAVQWKSDLRNFASMAVVKHALCGVRQTLNWSRRNWYPSEPTFIPPPDPAAPEDQGMLFFTALDGAKGESYLILVDAATMQTVSEVGPFPRIGFTTHGEFYPASESVPLSEIMV